MIYFLDFEASSLSESSFPIEIAWIDQDGRSESHLIRPANTWLEDGCPGWSAVSEKVHGISLQRLMAEGHPVTDVALRVVEVLSAEGALVYSDAPEWDATWLEKLLVAAGSKTIIEVLDVQKVFGGACRPLLTSLSHLKDFTRERMEAHVRAYARALIARAEEFEARRPRTHHRAMPDAESHWRVWSAIRTEVARALDNQKPHTSRAPLFKATFGGKRHLVVRAETAEVQSSIGSLTGELVGDTLTSWSLVALRCEDDGPCEIHALGWRILEANAWITSPIRVLDRTSQMIRTRCGRVYQLADPDANEISPTLLRHLSSTLRAWGYVDVQR